MNEAGQSPCSDSPCRSSSCTSALTRRQRFSGTGLGGHFKPQPLAQDRRRRCTLTKSRTRLGACGPLRKQQASSSGVDRYAVTSRCRPTRPERALHERIEQARSRACHRASGNDQHQQRLNSCSRWRWSSVRTHSIAGRASSRLWPVRANALVPINQHTSTIKF